MIELIFFDEYVKEWRRLERDYYRIRNWPVIGLVRQLQNIKRREKLTREYTKKMREWGVI